MLSLGLNTQVTDAVMWSIRQRSLTGFMGLLGPTAVHTLLIQSDSGQPVGSAGLFVKTSARIGTGGVTRLSVYI